MSQRRSVLITGCSEGGIGHALAKEFHQRGHRVIATARTQTSMKELTSLGIETYELDVTEPAAIHDLKTTLSGVLARNLDILINNAGIAYHGAALDTSLEDAKKVFDVNFFGVMLMVQEFVPMLMQSATSAPSSALSWIPFASWLPSSWTGLEGGRGLIINISSVNSILPTPFCAVYNASKAALNHYSNCLRLELAPFNVKVLNIITGGVQSNIVRPNLPPSGSLYETMRSDYESLRSTMRLNEQTPADQYACSVLSEAMKPYPRAWFYTAKFSLGVWFGYTFAPQTFFDEMMSTSFGLTKFTVNLRARKAKSD